jgi:hypothetical protein
LFLGLHLLELLVESRLDGGDAGRAVGGAAGCLGLLLALALHLIKRVGCAGGMR